MNNSIQIDPEFKKLVPPLTAEEYTQLEKNILQDGCREPISIWENLILDGHNRFEICRKHGLNYQTRTIVLHGRDEAIAWICSNQMGRRNLTEEQRHYLIGKRYEAEKRIGAPNPTGINRFTAGLVAPRIGEQLTSGHPTKKMTAAKIANEYHIGATSVEQYQRFSKAMDRISEVDHDFVKLVLNNMIKLSIANAIKLSRLSNEDIAAVTSKVRPNMPFHLDEDEIVALLRSAPQTVHTDCPAEPIVPITVKTMPKYDPDAEASSLALTIPSWRSSIQRVQAKSDLMEVSMKARTTLKNELLSLRAAIDGILNDMEATYHG